MPDAKPPKALKTKPLLAVLERLYRENNTADFIKTDPVRFPHRYKSGPDREIAAFLAAAIAWGRRDLILKSAEKMFSYLGPSPYAFVMEGKYQKLRNSLARPSRPAAENIRSRPNRGLCIHRTFFEDDLLYFCRGFRFCYEKYGSLENIFADAPDIWEGIQRFREAMAAGNSGASGKAAKAPGARKPAASGKTPSGKAGTPGTPVLSPAQPLYSKHISDPAASSACKRINLALRWLVRREGPVDLGLWTRVSPASLFIPLDVHVGRTARHIGLLERKTNDKKAVVSLTEQLREFCPEDPVKYDLALFSYPL